MRDSRECVDRMCSLGGGNLRREGGAWRCATAENFNLPGHGLMPIPHSPCPASKSASFHAWLCLSSSHTLLKRALAHIQTRKQDKQASTAAARCAFFFLHLKHKVKDKRHLARCVGALEERRADKCFQRWYNVLEAHAKLLDLARVRLALRRLRKSWTRWQNARGRAKTEALKFYLKSSRLSSSLSIFSSDYSSANKSRLGSCALYYWHQHLKSSETW